MLRTNILIISPRRNVIAYPAIQVVKKVVGGRDRRIVRSFLKLTAHHNVHKEDALDQSLGNAVTW